MQAMRNCTLCMIYSLSEWSITEGVHESNTYSLYVKRNEYSKFIRNKDSKNETTFRSNNIFGTNGNILDKIIGSRIR
jgi:hypothetical protein